MSNKWRTMSETLFQKLSDDELYELTKLIDEDPVRLSYALKAYDVRRVRTTG